MSGIDSIRDDCLFENRLTADEPRPREKTERIASCSFSDMAVCSLVAVALSKRKRHVYSTTVGIASPPIAVEAPVADAPPPPEAEKPSQPSVQPAVVVEIPRQVEAQEAAVVKSPQPLEVQQAVVVESPRHVEVQEAPAAESTPVIPRAASPSAVEPDSPETSTTSSSASPCSPKRLATSAASTPAAQGPQQAPKEKAPRCSEEDARKIKDIFTTVADNGMFELARSKTRTRLNAFGEDLKRHKVHPFEVLRCMPPEAMRKIFNEDNFLKVKSTLDGIKEGMEREIRTLEHYAPGLAEDMHKPVEPLIPLIRARNWKGVVYYLFDIPVGRKK